MTRFSSSRALIEHMVGFLNLNVNLVAVLVKTKIRVREVKANNKVKAVVKIHHKVKAKAVVLVNKIRILVQIVEVLEMMVLKIQVVNHLTDPMVKTHLKMVILSILGLKSKFSKIWRTMKVNTLMFT
jgi:hypothetical protein